MTNPLVAKLRELDEAMALLAIVQGEKLKRPNFLGEAADALVAMEQRLDASERDALRYRWLRDEDSTIDAVPEQQNDCGKLYGKELDAAIDKAMKD